MFRSSELFRAKMMWAKKLVFLAVEKLVFLIGTQLVGLSTSRTEAERDSTSRAVPLPGNISISCSLPGTLFFFLNSLRHRFLRADHPKRNSKAVLEN